MLLKESYIIVIKDYKQWVNSKTTEANATITQVHKDMKNQDYLVNTR